MYIKLHSGKKVMSAVGKKDKYRGKVSGQCYLAVCKFPN